MSEAHTSRPAADPTAATGRMDADPYGYDSDVDRPPMDITPDPTDASNVEDPAGGRPGPSRRRLIVLGAALVVGLAGAAGLGSAGWRISQQKDAMLDTPARVAGLTRDDSENAKATADYLRTGLGADIELDQSVGAVYADAANPGRSVLLAGGTALIWQPDRDLDTVFGLVSDNEGAVTGLHEVPAGNLGGVMKCGTTASPDGDLTVCGWSDHGSIALAMFPGRAADESARLLREIRAAVQTRK